MLGFNPRHSTDLSVDGVKLVGGVLRLLPCRLWAAVTFGT
jgi:hypothetical protein